jgi:hypothetical protein
MSQLLNFTKIQNMKYFKYVVETFKLTPHDYNMTKEEFCKELDICSAEQTTQKPAESTQTIDNFFEALFSTSTPESTLISSDQDLVSSK